MSLLKSAPYIKEFEIKKSIIYANKPHDFNDLIHSLKTFLTDAYIEYNGRNQFKKLRSLDIKLVNKRKCKLTQVYIFIFLSS